MMIVEPAPIIEAVLIEPRSLSSEPALDTTNAYGIGRAARARTNARDAPP